MKNSFISVLSHYNIFVSFIISSGKKLKVCDPTAVDSFGFRLFSGRYRLSGHGIGKYPGLKILYGLMVIWDGYSFPYHQDLPFLEEPHAEEIEKGDQVHLVRSESINQSELLAAERASFSIRR